MKIWFATLLFTFCVTAGVWGAEEVVVLRLEKPVSTGSLDSIGLAFLADLGDAYLIQGDGNSEEKLALAGAEFRRVLSTQPGLEVFLLKQRGPVEGMVHSALLSEAAPGTYLAAVSLGDVRYLDRLPYDKVRLTPGRFPETAGPLPVETVGPVEANPIIETLVARVSGDSLWQYMSELTGVVPIGTGQGPDTLRTRYSLSDRFDGVTNHLAHRLSRYLSDVCWLPYYVGTKAFYSASFPDTLIGWVVGNDQAVYRMLEEGLYWERLSIDAPYTSFWGVSSTGPSRCWVCGTGGAIYATDDGGETWSAQSSPARVTLNEICFLDSMKGWVVGDGGLIMRTTDGGTIWREVESGTPYDLYGLCFRDEDRGWACGEDGLTLRWDGDSWEARPSGGGDDLIDIDFGDDNTGWTAGHGRTVLKTTDGGDTWMAQGVPGEVNPFFKSVSVLSPSNAWIAGLNGTLLHTEDGGLSWAARPSGTLFGLTRIHFSDPLQGRVVGYGSTVLTTEDGGLSWRSRKSRLPVEARIRLENIVGTMDGRKSDRQVIICGHYDSISEDPLNLAPGADDNATGTAAVMEAARIFWDHRFERTIKFILFSGEEQGLFGSGEYAAKASHDGDVIAGVLNFDMIGYADTVPEDIDLIGNEASAWLVDLTAECAGLYAPGLGVKKLIDPTMVLSDHASFWKAGYYGLLGIEDRDIQYPFYHTTGDTLGNLNQGFMTDVVRMAVGTVAHLARPDTSGSGGTGSGLMVRSAFPNPFRSETEITFYPGPYGDVKVSIVDVMGRSVKTLDYTLVRRRGQVATWRGRNDAGEKVAAGIYFVVLQQDEDCASSKIVLLR
jgi:photosystem II stability/assembly factor-like uncharacterized protein